MDGSRARIALPSGPLEIDMPLLGDFNLENLLIACAATEALGIKPETIQRGIAECPQVPGRVERVGTHLVNQPTVIVDYAHTPDAIDKLLRSLRPLTSGHLITLFGCGGDRDRSKRPQMAKAVARWSDRVIATSDNPRTEDPVEILEDVEGGLGELDAVAGFESGGALGCYTVRVDRREGIELAVATARPQDLVVLAGKGHEDYQIIGHERFPSMIEMKPCAASLNGVKHEHSLPGGRCDSLEHSHPSPGPCSHLLLGGFDRQSNPQFR